MKNQLLLFVIILSLITLTSCKGEKSNTKANQDIKNSDDFLYQVNEVKEIKEDGVVVSGKILSGSITLGTTVELVGIIDETKTVEVSEIRMFNKLIDKAISGDNVTILIKGASEDDVMTGQVLATIGTISAHNKFSAQLKFLDGRTDSYQGELSALCYFFKSDSVSTIYIKGEADGGYVNADIEMLTKLPMNVGTTFEVLVEGEKIADGVVTAVD